MRKLGQSHVSAKSFPDGDIFLGEEVNWDGDFLGGENQWSSMLNPAGDLQDRQNTQPTDRKSSHEQRKKLAGMKSRQRKRRYLEGLEARTKALGSQLQYYDLQVSRTKDLLLKEVANSRCVLTPVFQSSNEHAGTYAELACCLEAEDPDIDRLDLLLDTLRYRIGANGKERQAKIDYYFKQIINALFPALHRYLMHAASSKIDLFTDNATQDSLTAGTFWTNEMFRNLHLEQRQIGLIAQRRKELVRRRGSTLLDIMTLHNIKHRLKSEEETIEDQMDDLRRKLDQEKAAKIIFFCEKFKYRSEVNLFEAFSSDPSPAKKVKME